MLSILHSFINFFHAVFLKMKYSRTLYSGNPNQRISRNYRRYPRFCRFSFFCSHFDCSIFHSGSLKMTAILSTRLRLIVCANRSLQNEWAHFTKKTHSITYYYIQIIYNETHFLKIFVYCVRLFVCMCMS